MRTAEPKAAASLPRDNGWRPGARWSENSKERVKRAELQERIDAMPAHQRPPMRELGRRSEAAPHPFRPMPADEAGGRDGGRDRPAYDLDGAFWQQGRALGGAVARSVGAGGGSGNAAPAPLPAPAEPAWVEPPLITVHRVGARVQIAASCPAAGALGLTPGMSLTQARAMVPGLDIRPSDPAGEAADLDRLARHAAIHWTPLVEVAAGEGLWLDIGASAHLYGGEAAFARRLLGFCKRLGFAARVAIADTAAAAHALASCANRPLTLCPPGEDAAAIAGLPIAALRIEPALVDQVRRLGVDTAGALASMPRAPLVRRFGKGVVARLDEADGARAHPIQPLVPATMPQACRRFAEPILTADAIGIAMAELVGELTATLLERQLGARTAVLTLTRVDAVDQRVSIGLARPSRDADHICRLLAMQIEKIEPGFGIEIMTLAAERFDPLAPQPVESPLSATRGEASIASLVDRLAARLGWRRLYRASAVESDVPERSKRRIDPVGPAAEEWGSWPRPARLLDPPERVEDVMVLLPDGIPRRFTWRRRLYTVARGDGPERIHGEWWHRSAERDAVRDYFQVEDRDGARFWLFRRGDGVDARTGDMSWHVHGLFG